MVWLTIILSLFFLLLCWLFISPLIIEIDTRVPQAGLRWISIGDARIWYKEEWCLSIRILFYQKTIRFSEMKRKPKEIKNEIAKKKRVRKVKITKMLKKIIRMIKTFRVTEWQLAIDTGDHTQNAQLYPLNYLPYTFDHLHINFRDENYLVLKIRNRPWKILLAFLR